MWQLEVGNARGKIFVGIPEAANWTQQELGWSNKIFQIFQIFQIFKALKPFFLFVFLSEFREDSCRNSSGFGVDSSFVIREFSKASLPFSPCFHHIVVFSLHQPPPPFSSSFIGVLFILNRWFQDKTTSQKEKGKTYQVKVADSRQNYYYYYYFF